MATAVRPEALKLGIKRMQDREAADRAAFANAQAAARRLMASDSWDDSLSEVEVAQLVAEQAGVSVRWARLALDRLRSRGELEKDWLSGRLRLAPVDR